MKIFNMIAIVIVGVASLAVMGEILGPPTIVQQTISFDKDGTITSTTINDEFITNKTITQSSTSNDFDFTTTKDVGTITNTNDDTFTTTKTTVGSIVNDSVLVNNQGGNLTIDGFNTTKNTFVGPGGVIVPLSVVEMTIDEIKTFDSFLDNWSSNPQSSDFLDLTFSNGTLNVIQNGILNSDIVIRNVGAKNDYFFENQTGQFLFLIDSLQYSIVFNTNITLNTFDFSEISIDFDFTSTNIPKNAFLANKVILGGFQQNYAQPLQDEFDLVYEVLKDYNDAMIPGMFKGYLSLETNGGEYIIINDGNLNIDVSITFDFLTNDFLLSSITQGLILTLEFSTKRIIFNETLIINNTYDLSESSIRFNVSPTATLSGLGFFANITNIEYNYFFDFWTGVGLFYNKFSIDFSNGNLVLLDLNGISIGTLLFNLGPNNLLILEDTIQGKILEVNQNTLTIDYFLTSYVANGITYDLTESTLTYNFDFNPTINNVVSITQNDYDMAYDFFFNNLYEEFSLVFGVGELKLYENSSFITNVSGTYDSLTGNYIVIDSVQGQLFEINRNLLNITFSSNVFIYGGISYNLNDISIDFKFTDIITTIGDEDFATILNADYTMASDFFANNVYEKFSIETSVGDLVIYENGAYNPNLNGVYDSVSGNYTLTDTIQGQLFEIDFATLKITFNTNNTFTYGGITYDLSESVVKFKFSDIITTNVVEDYADITNADYTMFYDFFFNGNYDTFSLEFSNGVFVVFDNNAFTPQINDSFNSVNGNYTLTDTTQGQLINVDFGALRITFNTSQLFTYNGINYDLSESVIKFKFDVANTPNNVDTLTTQEYTALTSSLVSFNIEVISAIGGSVLQGPIRIVDNSAYISPTLSLGSGALVDSSQGTLFTFTSSQIDFSDGTTFLIDTQTFDFDNFIRFNITYEETTQSNNDLPPLASIVPVVLGIVIISGIVLLSIKKGD